MIKPVIIYADDEARYRRLLELIFQDKGYTLLTAADGEEALDLLEKNPQAALLILDVMMPGMNGVEVCRYVRSFSAMPVLMVTALGDESHELEGLEAGADDYISKPFSNKILLTRVKALLRRFEAEKAEILSVGPVTLDPQNRTVQSGGLDVLLTFREFELLRYLMIHENQVRTREQILTAVWGYFYEGDPRTLDTHIKSLRKKLGEGGAMIRTIRQIGYLFSSGENS